MDKRIRVVVVDDHEPFRHALVHLLSFDGSIEVVGEGADGRDLVELCEELRPDVALVDLMMPELDGAAATSEVKKRFPEIGVIVFSVFNQERYVRRGLDAGADRYLVKGLPRGELLATIKQVAGEMADLAAHHEEGTR
ncbi:MAG: hypothetical protein Kow00129_12710 [Thermoleophilia bacterium]